MYPWFCNDICVYFSLTILSLDELFCLSFVYSYCVNIFCVYSWFCNDIRVFFSLKIPSLDELFCLLLVYVLEKMFVDILVLVCLSQCVAGVNESMLSLMP